MPAKGEPMVRARSSAFGSGFLVLAVLVGSACGGTDPITSVPLSSGDGSAELSPIGPVTLVTHLSLIHI